MPQQRSFHSILKEFYCKLRVFAWKIDSRPEILALPLINCEAMSKLQDLLASDSLSTELSLITVAIT